MSEDAAAAARRIVASVLAAHGLGDAPEGARAPARSGDPIQDSPGATTWAAPTTAPSEAALSDDHGAEDAGVIARRIVAQVLAEASGGPAAEVAEAVSEPTPASGERPPSDPGAGASGTSAPGAPVESAPGPSVPGVPAPAVEARVPDVPAEGVSVREAADVEVDVVADVPEDGSVSAADIVRRIVADVTEVPAAHPPDMDEDVDTVEAAVAPGEADTAADAEETGAAVDAEETGPPPPPARHERTRELTAADPLESAPTREVPARQGSLETEPTREVTMRADGQRPGDVTQLDDGADEPAVSDAPVDHRAPTPDGGAAEDPPPEVEEPASGATASPRSEAGVSVLDPEARIAAAAGFEAVVPVEPAVPVDDEPLVAPPEIPDGPEAKPHTLRWLLTSVVGAVALAVLIPLAVGALRSLVSLG